MKELFWFIISFICFSVKYIGFILLTCVLFVTAICSKSSIIDTEFVYRCFIPFFRIRNKFKKSLPVFNAYEIIANEVFNDVRSYIDYLNTEYSLVKNFKPFIDTKDRSCHFVSNEYILYLEWWFTEVAMLCQSPIQYIQCFDPRDNFKIR